MILADGAAALLGSRAGAGQVPRGRPGGLSSSLGSDAPECPNS
jgi:hypothetical protein